MPHDPTGSPDTAPLLSLVYASRAVVGFDAAALDTLLQHARTANERSGVTGLLLFRDHRFLQLLEGPAAAVHDKMTLIHDDPRHEHVTVLLEEHVTDRQFPDWTMGYAADGSLRNVDVPGYRTTFDDIDFIPDDHTAGPVLPALRELVRWFRANGSDAVEPDPRTSLGSTR